MVDFGVRLRALRTTNNMTQTQLAKRIGVSKSMVSAYETSMRLPSYDVLIKIAYTLKVTTDYLLGVDKRDKLNIPSITEEQKQSIYAMIRTFKD